VRRTSFNDAICPIARTSDLIGDGWSPLIMREACSGTRRFEDFQSNLSIPRATLTTRLDGLVEAGLLRRERYQDQSSREHYRLTQQGREFYSVLAAMWRFGSDWLFDGDLQVELTDRETGEPVQPVVVDAHTGRPIDVRKIAVAVVPGRR